MKNIRSILLAAAILVLLTGCNGDISISDGAFYTNRDGVYITIDRVEGEGRDQKLIASWHNETDRSVTFGYAYGIEYKTDGEWQSVLKRDFAVIEIACFLEPYSTAEMTYSTEYFDLFREGTYRLAVDYYIVETDGVSNTHGRAYVEFTVTQ